MYNFGLYIHVPYCKYMCHYCDFAKTANWDNIHVVEYFKQVKLHIYHWIKALESVYEFKISSVFFGGGTPGLFIPYLETILDDVRDKLTQDCEISLEINPENVTEYALTHAKRMGINRLSMGVQTFSQRGLNLLTRKHSASTCISAIERIREQFKNYNCDIIYGWPTQSLEELQSDLEYLVNFEVPHLSFYTLTIEPRTPFGRLKDKKILKETSDVKFLQFYKKIKKILVKHYQHDEVSNWSKDAYTCKHNWLYWQNGYYLSVGSGSYGYLPSLKNKIGVRYYYDRNDRSFIKSILDRRQINSIVHDEECSLKGMTREVRNEESWLYEYIGSSLRSSKGCDIDLIKAITGFGFLPSAFINKQVGKGLLRFNAQKLILNNQEWFREVYWCHKVIECFHSSYD
jgi:oxygen-independent coproporphyrinogen III oxidase